MLLHTKIIRIDDDIAVISSRNLDLRSLELDLEVTLVSYDRGVVAELQQLFADYLRQARPVQLHEWQTRPFMTGLCDKVARLTTPLQ